MGASHYKGIDAKVWINTLQKHRDGDTKIEKFINVYIKVVNMKQGKAFNHLQNGSKSRNVKTFLKKHRLDLNSLPSSGNVIEDIKIRAQVMQKRSEIIKELIAFFKDTGTRGMTIFDQLVELEYELAGLRRELDEKGVNPLKSPVYMNALKLKVEMAKFLERIGYEKQKDRIRGEGVDYIEVRR